MKYLIIKDRKCFVRTRLDSDKPFVYKGISIYYKSPHYYLSTGRSFFLEDEKKVCLLETKKYLVYEENGFFAIEVYVYDTDEGAGRFDFYENREVYFSSQEECAFFICDPYIKEGYIFLRNGFLESDLDLSVNGQSYDGLQLKQGDKVEYLSIMFYYYEDFLYVSHFGLSIGVSPYQIKEQSLPYTYRQRKTLSYLKQEKKELFVPELEKYQPYQKKGNPDIVKTILPNSVMSISICLASFLSIQSNLERGSEYFEPLTYMITPIAMLLTSIVLPLAFYFEEKRRENKMALKTKEAYLKRLKEYEETVKENIDSYLKSQQKRFFSLQKMDKEPFYTNKDDEDYLSMFLGTIHENHSVLMKEENEDVAEILKQIQKMLSSIGPLPLFLDLKQNNRVSIVAKKSEKDRFFLHFLLQMAYRHSFEDIYIAVYAKDDRLSEYYFDLPHLFYERRRFLFDKPRDLQELDQLKLDKPLLLFARDPIALRFQNEKIIVLYFSDDINDLLKDGKAIIDFHGNTGKLYQDKTTTFSYVEELIDLKESFHKLGTYNHFLGEEKTFTFSSVFENFDIEKSYREVHHDLRCDFAYSEDQLLSFDLHQNKQGPHGLIGGSTGSGKSELIISMLLSLCIRYAPDYLNLILIDYKGAGILSSLTYEGQSLPHIIASLSNLEGNRFERLIIVLRQICTRRQILFRRLSEACALPINDLDDYLDSDYRKYGFEKIAHLLVVIDEFAELKKEHPEDIRELISIARIGRSLGIHLILSTQKPAGNIDEEIWSNSRFKIALKVFEERDSQDLIREKNAAYLKRPGQFILRIDEMLYQAQSIYAKNDIGEKQPYEVSVLQNDLQIQKKQLIPYGKPILEISKFNKLIIETTRKLQIKTPKIDLNPPIPMRRKDLAKGNCIVLGEIDDYLSCKRGLLAYSLREDFLICSSRKKEVLAIANTLNEKRRQTVFIGSGILHGPAIADSFLYEESEEIDLLFEKLIGYKEEVTLLFEDVSIFLSYREENADHLLQLLKKKGKQVSVICLSSTVQVGFKLLSCFKNKVLIKDSDSSDILYLFNQRSRYKGDCFFLKEEPISFVPILEEEYKEGDPVFPSILPRLPEHICAAKGEKGIFLGCDKKKRRKIWTKEKLIVSSYDKERAELYQKAYQGMVEAMDIKEVKHMPEVFLWIGKGVFIQNIFFYNGKQDLEENEGLLFYKGKQILLRCIDHA